MKPMYQRMFEAMEREGEPDDDHINKIEASQILPQAGEIRAKNVYCKKEKDAHEECVMKWGIVGSPLCFFKSLFFFHCVSQHAKSDDNMDDCLEEYLALRSRYRSTKDPAYLNRMKAMIYPTLFTPKTEPER